MNFKLYDILSSLIPGFLLLLSALSFLSINFDVDLIVPYTAVAFLLGYIVNTISSWLEDFYYWTWGGKPSTMLLENKSIWKVKFYHSEEVKKLTKAETSNQNPSNDELFSIAMRYSNEKESRVEDFNSSYAFSRSLLTCVLIGSIFLIIKNYNDWRYSVTVMPILVIVWLRSKQRGYYYAREVLNTYLKIKNSKSKV